MDFRFRIDARSVIRVTSHLRQYAVRAMCPMVGRRHGGVRAEQLTAGKQ
jgi:hypothetical protein